MQQDPDLEAVELVMGAVDAVVDPEVVESGLKLLWLVVDEVGAERDAVVDPEVLELGLKLLWLLVDSGRAVVQNFPLRHALHFSASCGGPSLT